jgi:hypothetical protein
VALVVVVLLQRLSLDAARAQLRALVGMGRGEVGRRRTAYGASFSAQAC